MKTFFSQSPVPFIALLSACFLQGCAGGSEPTPARQTEINENLTEQVAIVLRETGAIKEGSRRSDLLKYYVQEAGPFTKKNQRFRWKSCPYIKVDVVFYPTNSTDESKGGQVIKSISTPYLGWSTLD